MKQQKLDELKTTRELKMKQFKKQTDEHLRHAEETLVWLQMNKNKSSTNENS